MAGEEIPRSPLTGRPVRPPAPPPGASLFIESSSVPPVFLPPTTLVPPPGATSAEPPGSPPGGDNEVIAGRYEIEAVLGEGGMGAVYKCFDRELRRPAALKMIHEKKRDERREARFMHEARAMARLQHPGCVQVYDVGRHTNGAPYLVMELVGGDPLIDLVTRHELTPGRSALLLHQIAGALHCAHELGIVHRDVKPHNILVSPAGAKLADFGIAKDEERVTQITVRGSLIGTLAYMPPEQTGREGDTVDGRSDVYALGATLYECLVGGPPFQGDRPILLSAILEREPTPPRRINPDIPRDLEMIALKCLRKEKEDRYQSALELQEDLGRYLSGEPVRARAPSVFERAWWWVKRHRKLVLTGIAAGVLVASAFGGVLGYGVAKDRSQARQALARGDECFAKGKFEEAEAVFAEAARLETPYAAEARDRVLKSRASKLVREGEEAFVAYRLENAREQNALRTLIETCNCDTDSTRFALSSDKKRRSEAETVAQDAARRMVGFEHQISVAFRRALEVFPHREIASGCLATWVGLCQAKMEAEPEAAEILATELVQIAAKFGLPAPLQEGSITVGSTPPGATVHIYRYELDPNNGVERPQPFRLKDNIITERTLAKSDEMFPLIEHDNILGQTPVTNARLSSGSYLLTFQLKGYVVARLPILVKRAEEQRIDVNLRTPIVECPVQFTYIPRGAFRAGERLVRCVELPDFFLQTNETSVEDWGRFWNDTGRPQELLPLAPQKEALETLRSERQLPITRISKDQADAYAQWFQSKFVSDPDWVVDLPSRAEIHRAMRGPLARTFVWGEHYDFTFCVGNGQPLRPCGSCPEDTSPFGVRDLVGSVSELTCDSAPAGRAVVAGGSWAHDAVELRVKADGRQVETIPSDQGRSIVGFRLSIRQRER